MDSENKDCQSESDEDINLMFLKFNKFLRHEKQISKFQNNKMIKTLTKKVIICPYMLSLWKEMTHKKITLRTRTRESTRNLKERS